MTVITWRNKSIDHLAFSSFRDVLLRLCLGGLNDHLARRTDEYRIFLTASMFHRLAWKRYCFVSA